MPSRQRRDAEFQKFGMLSVPATIAWDSVEQLKRQIYFLPILQDVGSEGLHGLVLVATVKERGEYGRIGYFKAHVEG